MSNIVYHTHYKDSEGNNSGEFNYMDKIKIKQLEGEIKELNSKFDNFSKAVEKSLSSKPENFKKILNMKTSRKS